MRAVAMLAGLALVMAPGGVLADNQLGYHELSPDQAAALPHKGGALGMDVRRGQVITDANMTFELLRVAGVRPGTAGAQAGFKPGDQIIAVDGTVFPSLKEFAAYIGSLSPGQSVTMDYLPNGAGPQQAQRVGVTIGAAGKATAPAPAPSGGLTTGQKIAIGVGAVALFGCYEAGCFNRAKPAAQ